VRFNINARVFSGPATKLVDSTIKLFSTTMRFSNVINFYRSGDPVVEFTGRHDTPLVVFKAAGVKGSINNHFLTPFIDDILFKLYKGNKTNATLPIAAYILPTDDIGDGLNHSTNVWRKL
ncbi:hypothetical protein, partial [Tenacibaculum sediminilitoris]|uniref:hypothetical protein n=1 Tax=Tenacibaculum sediminilitoris TaxID=1820334 RepID=UPI0038B42944